MEPALVGACVCACGGIYALSRRGGDIGRRLRRILGIAGLASAVLLFFMTLYPLSALLPAELEVELLQFRHATLNCSVETGLRERLQGEVGVATRHQWYHAVGYSLDDLRVHWAFPQTPSVEDTTDELRREFDQTAWKAVGGKYAHRIFGYLLPPVSGLYVFQVSLSETSARASVEVWLSPTSDPQQSLLLTYTAINTKVDHYSSAISSEVFLQSCGVYYFEFLEQAYNGRSVAEVTWRLPESWQFVPVPSSALVNVEPNDQQLFKTSLLPSMSLQRVNRKEFVGDSVLPVTQLPVLPECEYESRMAYSHQLKEYWGHKELVWSHIYPNTNSGTAPVPPAFAAKVLKLYTTAFNKSSHNGVVEGVHYMDTTDNLRNKYLDRGDRHKSEGTRILLEMDIKLAEGGLIHTSEYVYLPAGASTPCHTANFQWKKDVDVHIVVSVKNLGLWIQHLIHNMEHIYKVTRDQHFELIIVDYNSADLDVEAELRASSLPRWKVISLSGGFSRSGGLQAGIDYVTDPDSIVMTIDMHLTLPPGFVEYVRRHVVQGKMGFAPMFFRLNEGHTEMSREGFWETLTYGLLGMYKSDWVMTGGFDTQKYTTKWGGEDWDAVDKIRQEGVELFRLGYPGLVHYFHSKAGMWGH